MEPQQDITGRTAAVFASQRFGGRTRPQESRPVMGLVAARVIGNNPRRVFWLVVNNSPNTVMLGLAGDVTATNGVRLGPNGGFASMAVEEDGEAVAWELFGIADAAGSNVYALEVMVV